jgi:hypothetical protein
MAYFIFLKSLRSLGEFRKILMSKFLLNLVVQISKAFVYSKIQILFGNNCPQLSAHLTFRPSRGPFLFFPTGRFSLPFPLGLDLPASPAHHHGPTGYRSSSSSRTEAKHGVAISRPRAASTVAPTSPPEEKNSCIYFPFIPPH